MKRLKKWLLSTAIVVLGSQLIACGDGDSKKGGGPGSNKANFMFNCNVNGSNSVLSMDVEVVGVSGIVWGGGSNPDISAVIGTGEVNYYTSGSMQSGTGSYVFTGTNQYADFSNLSFPQRFRVKWFLRNNGTLDIIVDPYGNETYYQCSLTEATYL
jgi:hypothetical protein